MKLCSSVGMDRWDALTWSWERRLEADCKLFCHIVQVRLAQDLLPVNSGLKIALI